MFEVIFPLWEDSGQQLTEEDVDVDVAFRQINAALTSQTGNGFAN